MSNEKNTLIDFLSFYLTISQFHKSNSVQSRNSIVLGYEPYVLNRFAPGNEHKHEAHKDLYFERVVFSEIFEKMKTQMRGWGGVGGGEG